MSHEKYWIHDTAQMTPDEAAAHMLKCAIERSSDSTMHSELIEKTAREMFTEVIVKNPTVRTLQRIQQAWREASKFLGTFEDGPASKTPDRKGVTVNESPEARTALLELSNAMRDAPGRRDGEIEYKVISTTQIGVPLSGKHDHTKDYTKSFEVGLTEQYGKKGWNLCAVINGTMFIFSRPKR